MNEAVRKFVEHVAMVSQAVGFQAGVGASGIAGMIISCLAIRPDLIDRFMDEGAGLIDDGEIDASKGCLTFYNNIKGDVTTPRQLRISMQVRDIIRKKLIHEHHPASCPPISHRASGTGDA